jgi:hypothetical protein
MHYVSHRSHHMQKHKFIVTCPGTLFVKSVLDQPEYEKLCDHVSGPRCIRMNYVTHRSQGMLKLKFGVKHFPAHFLSNPYRSHLSMKNVAITFRASDAPE